jgi:hypothetical protein
VRERKRKGTEMGERETGNNGEKEKEGKSEIVEKRGTRKAMNGKVHTQTRSKRRRRKR